MEIFHEVAADGALFFEADNDKQFAEQVLQLENSEVLKDLVEKGHRQADNFAWAKSAQALYEVCQRLVANKP
jgi:glycosyltransferase involved in cell wall biosynthesis